jgi:hypothetical protein
VSKIFRRRARVQIEDLVVDSGGEANAGIRIAFKVEKTDEPKPNKLELNIYNLKQATRDRITKEHVNVDLEAGYAEDIGIIFKGDTRKPWHPKEGSDIVTKVSAGDGEVALRGARFNQSFAPNTKLSDVLLSMVDKLGVNAQQAKERIKRGDFRGGLQVFSNGFNYSGPLQNQFDQRMKEAGLEWSVQSGELQVLAKEETVQTTALRLAPDTGLIGSPERHKDTIKCHHVLIASVRPGQKVILDSRDFSGVLKLKKVIYRGDTWGDEDFLCESYGVPL